MKRLITLTILFIYLIANISFLNSQIFLFTFEGETDIVTNENAVGTPTYSANGIGTGSYSGGSSSTCSGSSNDAKTNSGWNTGEAHQFNVNTTGYENMSFSVCIRSSSTAVNNFRIEVSNNGTDYTTIVNNFNPSTSFTSYSGTLPATMNNQSSVIIQIYKVDEPVSSGNNIRIDNAQLAVTLPVQLSEFIGEQFVSSIQLNWQTSTEINNDYFTIQHSLDGRSFSDLEIIKGAGNSYVTKAYSYIHRNPVIGINFYRLKQTDFDGNESFSPVASIKFGKNVATAVYPNLATDKLFIHISKEYDENITASIFDLTGKLHKHLNFKGGSNSYQFPLLDLMPGQYFLQIIMSNQTRTHKFIKL